MEPFDIVISGGGIVGLSLACGLKGTGLRVAVIECRAPEVIFSSENKESVLRVSSINTASRRLFQHMQVWNDIILKRANPYRSVEVWERDSFGHIAFNGSRLGYPEMGYIIENQVINQALWHYAEQLAEVTLIAPAKLQHIAWNENEAYITLDTARILTARLVVAADGARSWLRTYTNIPLTFWDYQHHALVATVRTTQPHSNIARQTFYDDSILAFLPLKDPHLSSIVWSLPPEIAQERLTTSTKAFNASLAINFSLALGLCELQSERQTFSLTGRYARNFAAHRLVLIGDAAHTIHPLAGQGVNLGLMDVAELLGEIRRLLQVEKDIGHYPNLRRYERSRKYSVAIMLASIQGLHDLFTGRHPIKKWIRDASLRLADTLPSLKLYFVKRAMGLNDLPNWLAAEPYN